MACKTPCELIVVTEESRDSRLKLQGRPKLERYVGDEVFSGLQIGAAERRLGHSSTRRAVTVVKRVLIAMSFSNVEP